MTIRRKIIANYWKMQTKVILLRDLIIVSGKDKVSIAKKFADAFRLETLMEMFGVFVAFVITCRAALNLSWTASFIEYVRTFTNAMGDLAFNRARGAKVRLLVVILILLTSFTSTYLLTLLTAISTTSEYTSEVESLSDLQNPNLKLYTHAVTIAQMTQLTGRPMLPMHNMLDCVKKIYKNEDAVCLTGSFILQLIGVRENNVIRLSKAPYLGMMGYDVRPDWPLLPKFNWMFQRLYETGISEHYFGSLSKHQSLDYAQEKESRADELQFTLSILVVGYTAAMIAFVYEKLNSVRIHVNTLHTYTSPSMMNRRVKLNLHFFKIATLHEARGGRGRRIGSKRDDDAPMGCSRGSAHFFDHTAAAAAASAARTCLCILAQRSAGFNRRSTGACEHSRDIITK
ncbi:unnamed protein product [Trichogramma brassicae]|uniref:Ionotropic glutamate receptor C-terminal domain-containing protein n=1 Tax=Trichogramma brassicae TaxID=86971 RepID=A0A6H5HY26_9HYME|nr:unnamed protein product [Trichogramma brassicae]